MATTATVTEGALLQNVAGQDGHEIVSVSDNSSSRLAITTNYKFDGAVDFSTELTESPQQLLHIVLPIQDGTETAGLSFELALMDGQQYQASSLLFTTVQASNTDNTVLPVELVEFTAQADGEAVQLRWATASETNNAGFEVQMHAAAPEADGGAAWQPQGWVDGWGTTAEPQQYAYRVDGVAPGTHRFRLKQVDFDGTFAYSPEVEVTIGLDAAYRLTAPYPNPFNPEARFSLMVRRAQHVEVAVYDALGRRVRVLHDGPLAAGTARSFVVEGHGLKSGVYFIRAVGETFVATQRATLVK
ncbi:MAG: T9SS type A sorting domain-containing protein [Bacteroidetes bacterium]|nr:T9SS type A sorting domain-containing protein [Bacteroidota bacterium]